MNESIGVAVLILSLTVGVDWLLDEVGVSLLLNNLPLALVVPDGLLGLQHLLVLVSLLRLGVFIDFT